MGPVFTAYSRRELQVSSPMGINFEILKQLIENIETQNLNMYEH
jgi:hypothetical protein